MLAAGVGATNVKSDGKDETSLSWVGYVCAAGGIGIIVAIAIVIFGGSSKEKLEYQDDIEKNSKKDDDYGF